MPDSKLDQMIERVLPFYLCFLAVLLVVVISLGILTTFGVL